MALHLRALAVTADHEAALVLPQAVIHAAKGKELIVRATLDQPPAVEHHDGVGVHRRDQSMGDGDDGAGPSQPLEGLLDGGLLPIPAADHRTA